MTVAVPSGQPQPAGPSRFPLAGLWELIATQRAWSFAAPETPVQTRGGRGGAGWSATSEATRANGGNGRAPAAVPGAVPEYAPPAAPDIREQTTGPAKTGYDPATSQRIAQASTRRTDLFHNADGSLARVLYAQPKNYLGTGGWEPIDLSLTRTAGGQVTVKGNDLKVSLAGSRPRGSGRPLPEERHTQSPTSGVEERLATVTLPSGEVITFGVRGATPAAPALSGSVARYRDAFTATDLELTALAGGLTTELVLRPGAAVTQWVLPFESRGLTVAAGAGGSVVFADAKGKTVATIGRGLLRDAAGAEAPLSLGWARDVDGKAELKVAAETAWLNETGRVFPVRAGVSITTTAGDGGKELVFGEANVPAYQGLAGKEPRSAKLRMRGTASRDCTAKRSVEVRATDVELGCTAGELTGDLDPKLFAGTDQSIALTAMTGAVDVSQSTAVVIFAGNDPPQIDARYPSQGQAASTLTPELVALGYDADGGPQPLKYLFEVHEALDNGQTVKVAESGVIANRAWTVPVGAVKWNKSYHWVVNAFDGAAWSPTRWLSFHIPVPQRPITAGLSQNGDKGFSPSVGNYTTTAVDAEVPTIGPALTIERYYNSRDPRIGALRPRLVERPRLLCL